MKITGILKRLWLLMKPRWMRLTKSDFMARWKIKSFKRLNYCILLLTTTITFILSGSITDITPTAHTQAGYTRQKCWSPVYIPFKATKDLSLLKMREWYNLILQLYNTYQRKGIHLCAAGVKFFNNKNDFYGRCTLCCCRRPHYWLAGRILRISCRGHRLHSACYCGYGHISKTYSCEKSRLEKKLSDEAGFIIVNFKKAKGPWESKKDVWIMQHNYIIV